MKTLTVPVICLCSLVALSCGPKTLPACKQASLDQPDGGTACRAARVLLSCSSGGMTQVCLSDEPTGCNGPSSGCESQCRDDEYAVGCGQGSQSPDWLGDCRSLPPAPGLAFFCCPCS